MLGAETLGLFHLLPPLFPAAPLGRCTWSNLACGVCGVSGVGLELEVGRERARPKGRECLGSGEATPGRRAWEDRGRFSQAGPKEKPE